MTGERLLKNADSRGHGPVLCATLYKKETDRQNP